MVAEEGHLTRAATRLHLSQPALSLQLKKLQQSLDIQLFVRTAQGMQLTEHGQRLLPIAQQSLKSLAELEKMARGLNHQAQGVITIGTIVDPEFLRLGAFLQYLVQHHPALSIELRHGISGAVARQVEQGHIDVAFTLGPPGFSNAGQIFWIQPLAEFEYRVIAPPGWPVQSLSWPELARFPWIVTPPESVHSQLLRQVDETWSLKRQAVARVDVEASMLDLVKSGVALALARDSLALQLAHEAGIVIAEAVSLPAALGILCLQERRQEPTIAATIAAVQQVWGISSDPS